MNDTDPGDGADRLKATHSVLQKAFDQMEAAAVSIGQARQLNDLAALEEAVGLMRQAQVVFLRVLNRSPAETARFLALRQDGLVEGMAFEIGEDPQTGPGKDDARPLTGASRGPAPDPDDPNAG